MLKENRAHQEAMEKAKAKLQLLVKDGEGFTYNNFAAKSDYGYPSALTPEWVTWTTRVKGAVTELFGKGSAPYETLSASWGVHLLGNEADQFLLCKSYLLSALNAALEALGNDTFGELKQVTSTEPRVSAAHSNRVFVVHGHDDRSKTELEIILTEMGLEPVVLHRQPDEGRTIIEKFEKHSDVGFAFILLTPDDVSYPAEQVEIPDAERTNEYRARPNVIFEFGYFLGRLGRPNVCCLYKGDVSLPSDVNGILYKKFNSSVEEVAYSITKELKARGYQLK